MSNESRIWQARFAQRLYTGQLQITSGLAEAVVRLHLVEISEETRYRS